MNDHGFVVCAYNRTVEKVDHFLANEAKGNYYKSIVPLIMINLYLIQVQRLLVLAVWKKWSQN